MRGAPVNAGHEPLKTQAPVNAANETLEIRW